MASQTSVRPGDRVLYQPSGHQGTLVLTGIETTSASVLFDGFKSPVVVPSERLQLLSQCDGTLRRTAPKHGGSQKGMVAAGEERADRREH